MKLMFQYICVALLLFNIDNAHALTKAQNSAEKSVLLPKILKQLGFKEKDINLDLYAEKVLPYDKTKSAVVLPKYNVNKLDEYGFRFFVLDAYILIVDNLNGKIIHKFQEDQAWTSDAMVLTGITLDTSIYKLNEQTRAFGVRVDTHGSSNPNPYSNTTLSLFIPQNKSLKRVLKNYNVYTQSGEWDTRCAGEFDKNNTLIDIDLKNKNNNLNDLILRETNVNTKNFLVKDDCQEKKKTTRKTIKLKYNGTEYL